MNNDIGQPNNESNNTWKSIGFFNGEEHLSFTFKKTEKITSALYLITSLIKDNEPLKWELREKGVSLLSSAISMNGMEPRDRNTDIHIFFSVSLDILSLLGLAYVAGLISEMNHSVLKREIEAIVELLKTKVFEDAAKAGYVLSDSFFKTESTKADDLLSVPNPSMSFKKNILKSPEAKSFTQNQSRNLNSKELKKDKTEVEQKVAVKDKKDSRKAAILELLSTRSNLTIKDFARAILGCSEKTIQRELLELVSKGVIKKEGERRWSTYSLI